MRIFADNRPFTVAESFYADAKFYFELVEKVYKPKSVVVPESNVVAKNIAESSSGRKIYEYIPSDQRKEGDPIFRVINKSSIKRGTKMPIILPPLVQHKIEQDKDESPNWENKNNNVVHISLQNKDDDSLPIALYDNRVLYMMQKMGYDTLSGPSLCDGRGQRGPFEKALSPEQLEALHKGHPLKEKRHGLGYEVCMTSTEFTEPTEASPQMEDGNQPTIDDREELNIGTLEEPRPIFIGAHLSKQNKEEYRKFLSENRDVFAWTYEEMQGWSCTDLPCKMIFCP